MLLLCVAQEQGALRMDGADVQIKFNIQCTMIREATKKGVQVHSGIIKKIRIFLKQNRRKPYLHSYVIKNYKNIPLAK